MAEATKTVCPVDLATFLATAGSLVVVVRRHGESKALAELTLTARSFSSGGFGWYAGESVRVPVGEHQCKVQLGLNMVLANSKDAPRTAAVNGNGHAS